MNIHEKLAAVQHELKAPKDKQNTFAGYSYRSAEGILEAVKPVLAKHDATILIGDEITIVGDRIYVKATAHFIDIKDGSSVSASAYAREADQKKGLDVSQITGVASSYARKYALNGLLLIDDTKDADTDEFAKQTVNIADEIRGLAKKAGVSEVAIINSLGIQKLEDIDRYQYGRVKAGLLAKINAVKFDEVKDGLKGKTD